MFYVLDFCESYRNLDPGLNLSTDVQVFYFQVGKRRYKIDFIRPRNFLKIQEDFFDDNQENDDGVVDTVVIMIITMTAMMMMMTTTTIKIMMTRITAMFMLILTFMFLIFGALKCSQRKKTLIFFLRSL